jgi:hypothetical protein
VAFVNSDFEGLIAAVRQRRNISQTQKWASVSLGTLLPQAVAKLPAYQNGPLIAAWMANRCCGHRPTQATKRSAEGSVPLPRDCSAAERRPYGHHIPPPLTRGLANENLCRPSSSTVTRDTHLVQVSQIKRFTEVNGEGILFKPVRYRSQPSTSNTPHAHTHHRTSTRTTAHAPPRTHWC